MYKLISEIAERCHTAATKRGKDTSCVGCMDYLRVELAEYWKAVEKGANVPNFNETTAKATELSDEDFNALYGEKIHNTTTDELADILIVATRCAVGRRRRFPTRKEYRRNAAGWCCAVYLRTHYRAGGFGRTAYSGKSENEI